jgi:hypothetical protein
MRRTAVALVTRILEKDQDSLNALAAAEMARRYQADEVMVLTITGAYETRRRSYELLMAAFQ